ncbi:hypothetical protein [Photobacterium ganghwense]|uniref:hypothetical protein n=1 Tax=Photobacterium ganghwense TaxID=320778 RepID=UPI0039EF6450
MTSPQLTTVYFDDEPGVGVNAYFEFGAQYFRSFHELRVFCDIELGGYVEFVEITDANYSTLKSQGVFDVI